MDESFELQQDRSEVVRANIKRFYIYVVLVLIVVVFSVVKLDQVEFFGRGHFLSPDSVINLLRIAVPILTVSGAFTLLMISELHRPVRRQRHEPERRGLCLDDPERVQLSARTRRHADRGDRDGSPQRLPGHEAAYHARDRDAGHAEPLQGHCPADRARWACRPSRAAPSKPCRPGSTTTPARKSCSGCRMAFFVAVFVIVVLVIVQSKTILGKYAAAIGGNRTAAELSGINVILVVWLLYIIVGLFRRAGRRGAGQLHVPGRPALGRRHGACLHHRRVAGRDGVFRRRRIGRQDDRRRHHHHVRDDRPDDRHPRLLADPGHGHACCSSPSPSTTCWCGKRRPPDATVPA